MRVAIDVQAIMPTYADQDVSPTDRALFNELRDRDTNKMIEKAITSVLVKRGAWASRIKVAVKEEGK